MTAPRADPAAEPLEVGDEGLEWAWIDPQQFATTDEDCEGAQRAAFVRGFVPREHVGCGWSRLRDWFERDDARGPLGLTEVAAILRQSHPLVLTWVRQLKELGFVRAISPHLAEGVRRSLLVGIIGLFILDSDANILSLNGADNVLHLASAGLGHIQQRDLKTAAAKAGHRIEHRLGVFRIEPGKTHDLVV